MDDATLYKAMKKLTPLILPPVNGARPISKRNTENMPFTGSLKWRSPFEQGTPKPGGFVNRLFKNNKKATSAQNLPQKIYLEQF
jgi:hypothetical protein